MDSFLNSACLRTVRRYKMRIFVPILILSFFIACTDRQKNIDTTTENIIPWDTLGYTVEGQKIKSTDIKVAGHPKNDSLFKVDIEKALTENGYKDFLNNHIILIQSRLDSSGSFINKAVDIIPRKDTVIKNRIIKIILPVINKSEPWTAPLDHYDRKTKGFGYSKLTNMTFSQELKLTD